VTVRPTLPVLPKGIVHPAVAGDQGDRGDEGADDDGRHAEHVDRPSTVSMALVNVSLSLTGPQ
jgi:hypothetical protein